MNVLLISIINLYLAKIRKCGHPPLVRGVTKIFANSTLDLNTPVLKLMLLSPNNGCSFTVSLIYRKIYFFKFTIFKFSLGKSGLVQALTVIGEGNGNPIQCSCLENPRNGGAWWAAVHGVAQSQTRLKRLSSRGFWMIKSYTVGKIK